MKWPMVRLKEVASVESGFGFPLDYQGEVGGEIPFYKVSDMNLPGNEVEMRLHNNSVSLEKLSELGARDFPPETVIFPKIGAAIATEKKRILTRPSTFDNNVMGIVSKKYVIPKYIFYWISSIRLEGLANPGHVPSIKKSVMEEQMIPLPPLSEERRIVEILDEADRIRRLRKEANQKAEKIIPALFIKMFGNPETNPKGWKIQHIKDVVLSTDYGTSSKASSDGLGLPIIRMGNIDYEGRLDLKDLKYVQLEHAEIERLSLKAGDILFNRTNSKELVGKTGLWDGGIEAVPASYFIRVRVNPDIITPCFLWVFMNSNHMKKLLFSTARGAIGQANINARELKDFSIFIPLIDKQKLFENMLEKIKRLIHHQSESLLKSENLFSMLLMQSFSGRK